MRSTFLLSALSLAAFAVADSVPEGIAPNGSPPDGCDTTVSYNFTIGIAVSSSKRDDTSAASAVGCTLKDGVLKDPYGRVGSIVSNYQFQFDGPPQAGAIYTGGFSVCKNTSLALGPSARWWRCMSGDFGNLYDRSIGDQCTEVRIVAQNVSPSSSSSQPASTSTAASSGSASTAAAASASTSGSVSGSGSVTSGSVTSASTTDSASPTFSVISVITPNSNSSVTAVAPSVGSPSASATGTKTGSTGGSSAPTAKTGAAAPTRLPKRETFGAVIGVLGAALLL